jgi:hypothetical protein
MVELGRRRDHRLEPVLHIAATRQGTRQILDHRGDTAECSHGIATTSVASVLQKEGPILLLAPKSKPRAGVVLQQPAAVVLAMMPIDADAHSVVSQR